MFVSQIKIKEFRGIKGCKKPIKLSKLTVLIGRNNSGKSTILEALSLLPRPNSTQYPWNKDKCTFLVDLHGGASSLIYGYAGTAEIEYLINGKTWSYEISTRADITYKINGEDGDYISDADLASLLNIDKEEVSKSVFFLPFLTKDKIKELDKTIRKLKNEIVKLGANARVAKEVSKTVDDSYTEVLWEEGCLSLRKEFPDRAPLYVNLEDLGDGIKKAVRVMLLVEVTKPKLILWDDFEASAHPTLIEMLLKWLSDKDCQVIISTHSIDVLRALLEVKSEDTTVLQLKKTANDILLHEALTLDELKDMIYASHDPRLLVDALKL